MYSKNMLLRDIKTYNIFLTKDGIINKGDFGIAKALGTQVDFANPFLGTPYFMSPGSKNPNSKGQRCANAANTDRNPTYGPSHAHYFEHAI